MGYLVEQYRKSDEELMHKLHEAKMLLCEIIEELKGEEDNMYYGERNNYRMNNRMSYRDKEMSRGKGRYDY